MVVWSRCSFLSFAFAAILPQLLREGAHVHFQLSTEAPETHDMPGAVTLDDRPKALVRYPDPRWVLGMLY